MEMIKTKFLIVCNVFWICSVCFSGGPLNVCRSRASARIGNVLNYQILAFTPGAKFL